MAICISLHFVGNCTSCSRFKILFKMAPHTGSATHEQLETLLNFLDEHKDLARGRLRSLEGKVQAKRLWEELCNTLNCMGGCTKTVQQWQKVWFDRKHLAKKAAADSRRSASATGGGPSVAHRTALTQWEEKVLSIMDDGFGERQTGARVPAFEENEPIPSPSRSEQPRFSQPLSLEFLESGVVEPIQEEQSQPIQLSEPAIEEPSTARSSSTRSTRRRRAAAGSDVRSRLFDLEDQRVERETVRNTELAGIHAELAGIHSEAAGIRAVLLQLYGLLNQYLDNRHRD